MRADLTAACCYLTLSFSYGQSLLPTWANFYQHTPNKHHVLNDMEVNDLGELWMYVRVYDTLTSVGTVVKFANNGWYQVWESSFQDIGVLSDLEIDPSGNAYVATTVLDSAPMNNTDLLVKKFDDTGSSVWTTFYNDPAPQSADRANALVVDSQGNTIVTGYSGLAGGGDKKWLTVKLDTAGNVLWTAEHYPTIGHPGNSGGVDIACDAADNIYVTGSSGDTVLGNAALIKYASAGTELWLQRLGGSFFSEGSEIRMQGDRVFVAGSFMHNGLDSIDVFVAMVDTGGNHYWTTFYNAPPSVPNTYQYNGEEVLRDLAVDEQWNSYLTGTQYANNGAANDLLILKVDSTGAVQWGNNYGPLGGMENGGSVFVGGDGSVFVTGNAPTSTPSNAIHTLKYDPTGDLVWDAQYGAVTNGGYRPGLIRAAGGGFYVASYQASHVIFLHYDITTGLDDPKEVEDDFSVAPNPANNTVTLTLSDQYQHRKDLEVQVYDPRGRLATRKAWPSAGSNSLLIPLHELSMGLYLVRVWTPTGPVGEAQPLQVE